MASFRCSRPPYLRGFHCPTPLTSGEHSACRRHVVATGNPREIDMKATRPRGNPTTAEVHLAARRIPANSPPRHMCPCSWLFKPVHLGLVSPSLYPIMYCGHTLPRYSTDVVPMLFYCWASVADAGSTIKQHWVNVSCFLA